MKKIKVKRTAKYSEHQVQRMTASLQEHFKCGVYIGAGTWKHFNNEPPYSEYKIWITSHHKHYEYATWEELQNLYFNLMEK